MSGHSSSRDAKEPKPKPFYDPRKRAGQLKFFTNPNPVEIDHLEEDDFHVIASDEKKIMFQEYESQRDAQEGKAREIVNRLTLLAPAIARRFEVKTDLIEKMTLRVWTQRETEDSRENSYIALSYCWDSTRHGSKPGVKYPLPISGLMFSALAAERGRRTTGVWIDQLCINQRDKKEKSISVAAMDSIYRSAEVVFVALLDIEVPLAQQAFLRDYIPEYESFDGEILSPHQGETPPFFQKHPVFKRLLEKILESRWFTRAWCNHEMELGNYFVFYIPCQPEKPDEPCTKLLSFSRTFLWDMLVLSTEVPLSEDKAERAQTKDVQDRLVNKFDLRKLLLELKRTHSDKADPSDRLDLIQSYAGQIRHVFGLGAGGDPDLPQEERLKSVFLDKTSIVLNTLGTGLAVTREQHTGLAEDEYMMRLMILGLSARDPTVLCTTGTYFKSSNSRNSKISWLCRPAFEDLGSGTDRCKQLPCMSSAFVENIRLDPSPSLNWIALDVLALPPCRPASEHCRSLASRLTEKMIELGLGRSPSRFGKDLGAEYAGKTDLLSRFMLLTIEANNPWGPGPLYQYWHYQTFLGVYRTQFNCTVACLIECGMKWTLGMAQRCGYPQPPHLESKFNAYFKNDGFLGMEDMSWARSEEGRGAVDALFSAAMFLVTWGVMRTQKNHAAYMPMLYSHGIDGKAIVFTVTDCLAQVVMPCGLLADDYARLPRIWLLQAEDDPYYEKMVNGIPPKWFLRSKCILFTDVEEKDTIVSPGSANNGLPGWRSREGVIVHGPSADFDETQVNSESSNPQGKLD